MDNSFEFTSVADEDEWKAGGLVMEDERSLETDRNWCDEAELFFSRMHHVSKMIFSF